MENPFFSVIVPMHNNSKTINLTLDSLKKQTFTSFEVIFVDDASDDFSNTEKIIIDSLSGKVPFTIVRHIENKNGAAARNLGITLARGEYIAFLDADDEWLPIKLSYYHQVIKKVDIENEKKVFYSKLKIRDIETGNIMAIRPSYGVDHEPNMSIAEYLFSLNGFIQTSTIVAHRSILDKVMFNEKFIRHQDYDFCIHCDYLGIKFHFIDEVLTIYNKFNNTSARALNGKKESEAYSFFWLKEMKSIMRFRERCAYRAYILPSRCRMDNNNLKAVLYAMLNLPFTGFRAIKFKVLNKIKLR